MMDQEEEVMTVMMRTGEERGRSPHWHCTESFNHPIGIILQLLHCFISNIMEKNQ